MPSGRWNLGKGGMLGNVLLRRLSPTEYEYGMLTLAETGVVRNNPQDHLQMIMESEGRQEEEIIEEHQWEVFEKAGHTRSKTRKEATTLKANQDRERRPETKAASCGRLVPS